METPKRNALLGDIIDIEAGNIFGLFKEWYERTEEIGHEPKDGDGHYCLVCDGMGGTKGGAEASRIASEKFVSIIDDFISPYIGNKTKKLQGSDIKTVMLDALDQANTAVHDYALMHPTLRGMGTTLVAALIIQNTVFCVNVGDSRMYFMKGDKIKQITKDHSYVQYLLDIGQITEQEAEVFPNKNIITRAVGTEGSVKGDFIREGVSEGTYMLLCSDGLYNFVSNEGIRDIVVGSDKKIIKAKLSSDLIYFSAKEIETQTIVYCEHFLYADINRGDIVGRVEVRDNDNKTLCESYLVSMEDAVVNFSPKEKASTLLEKLKNYKITKG